MNIDRPISNSYGRTSPPPGSASGRSNKGIPSILIAVENRSHTRLNRSFIKPDGWAVGLPALRSLKGEAGTPET